MTGSIRHSAIWELAKRQHWVVTRRQLLALGMTAKGIEQRLANGRLCVIWRGVYSVGRPELSREGMLMAAVLACGPGAVLTDDSATELWGMRSERSAAIHVSVRGTGGRRLRGIVIHRRRTLLDEDVTEHRGIPVTTPARTLIDFAARSSRSELAAAVNEADKLDLIAPDALRAEVDRRMGLPGTRPLREMLDRAAFVLTDSELERRFLPISVRAGLPRPETQVYVNGFRVDFYYREIGLVVETDGLRYHRTPAQQARDRLRDQAHTAAGMTALRFTHAQVCYEPTYVEAILAATASRLSNRPRYSGADSTSAR